MSKIPIAVLVADVHLHPHAYGNHYDAEGNSFRVGITLAALQETLNFAARHNVPWFSLGDLLHVKTHVPVDCLRLRSLFDKFQSVQKYLLVGNHERHDRFSQVTTLDWLASESTKVIKEGTKIQVGQTMLYAFPWLRTPEEVSSIWTALQDASPTLTRVLLGHGTVDGTRLATGVRLSNPSVTPETLGLQYFNLAFFGDIHEHGLFGTNGYYVGCLHPQSFGERGLTPGFVVLYQDLTWERMPVKNAPRFEYRTEEVQNKVVQTEDGAILFQTQDPKAVADTVVATQDIAPVYDFAELDKVVDAYVRASGNPAVQPGEVLAALKEIL